MLNKKFLLGTIFSLAILLTSCSKDGGEVTENISETSAESVSVAETVTVTVTETTAETTEKTSESETAETMKAVEDKYKELLEKYVSYMKNECGNLLKNKTECRIYLRDIYGDGALEMLVCLTNQDEISSEIFFAEDENGGVQLIGAAGNWTDTEFYSDGKENYAISKLLYENKAPALKIYRLGEMPYVICCDAYEYSNTSAEEFINNTQLLFCRFDEWFDEDNELPAEAFTEDFYYEDTGTYEAYMLSRYILELTGVTLSEYRKPYNTIPLDGYLAKRDEYSAVMDRLENMMTKSETVPEFDSGWIEINKLNQWLKNLNH